MERGVDVKPTIGRIVHVGGAAPGTIVPALVVAVHADDEMAVALTVFQPNGPPYSLDRVPYGADPGPHSWSWPPRL